MKVMCLNGWGGAMQDALIPYLRAAQPDILCLQEVVHSPATEETVLTYRDGARVLPQRANFFAEVAATLPDHQAIFCPAAQGVLWDGEVSVPSQWGLATFVHRALPIIGQVQGFVHKDYGSDGYGDHPRSRSAHGVRVYDYATGHATGRTVSVTHMHGLHIGAGKGDTPERAAQAQRFLELARQVAQPGDLQVLCGDFNVLPGSETLSLLEDEGYTELVTGRGFTSTRSSAYEKPERFADYMLINDVEAVQGFEVVYAPEVSDHCPLALTI